MRRRYELFDIVVVIGFCATIAAAGFMFMAANGRLSISLTEILAKGDDPAVMELDDVRWLQPILGQAIVDQYLLDHRYATGLLLANMRFAAVSEEYTQLQDRPFGYLDSIRASTRRAEPDHATRVQEVMGRAIVQFTQRGVQSGMLLSGGDLREFNARMIEQTDDWGQQITLPTRQRILPSRTILARLLRPPFDSNHRSEFPGMEGFARTSHGGDYQRRDQERV